MRDFKEWEQELLALLQKRPVVEITGVLERNGFRAARVGEANGQAVWSMSMSFLAWRVGTDAIRKDCPLTFRRKGAEDEFRRIADAMTEHTLQEVATRPNSLAVRMPPNAAGEETVIRVRGRVIIEGLLNIQGAPARPEAWLDEFVEIHSSDDDLQNYLADLQNPVTWPEKTFGTFTLDRNLGWFAVETKFQRKKVALRLDTREQSDAEAAANVAHDLFKNAAKWNKRIRSYAADQLLSVKNDDWLNDDESPVTARQFKANLTLQSIIVASDQSFTFLYSDGEMFGDHAVEVSGSLTAGPTDASIQG